MKKPTFASLVLTLLALLAPGCSSSATSAPSRRAVSAPALAAAPTCQDALSCCLQRHPADTQRCGLSSEDAVAYLTSMQAREAKPDDELKQRCLRVHSRCKDAGTGRWTGDCNACLARCARERDWPYAVCHRP
ncbi:hypothetical protein [Corallococcus macrosporus]|uniref:Lipoprotein n=1 Tax=Corallococcus macrosporus DSM 14697 TaxID=1189310 RepID=A0A250JVJ5_9BACT|nr:hypothetical protein [Corallococcus macrosporus]ATB47492.1 lipoprotein [Corallococcus macrosporus DSM 14697]